MFTHRSLSALVAIGFVAVIVFGSHPGNFRQALLIILIASAALLLPLACIWFADDMGEYAGNLFAPGLAKPTPGVAIRVAGWFLLVVQFVVLLFLWGYS